MGEQKINIFNILKIILIILAVAIVADDAFKTPNIFEKIQIIILVGCFGLLGLHNMVTKRREKQTKNTK